MLIFLPRIICMEMFLASILWFNIWYMFQLCFFQASWEAANKHIKSSVFLRRRTTFVYNMYELLAPKRKFWRNTLYNGSSTKSCTFLLGCIGFMFVNMQHSSNHRYTALVTTLATSCSVIFIILVLPVVGMILDKTMARSFS